MRRRDFIGFVGGAVVVLPRRVLAQSEKIRVVGYLTPAAKPSLRDEVFRKGLQELGWIEGRNMRMEVRRAGNDTGRLAALAEELVRLKVDVMVATSTPAVHAARNATRKVPIPVVTISADPVGLGFIASLARPGGNITGISMMMPQLAGKRLELLREVFPKLSRVAFLAHGGDPAHKVFLREIGDAGRSVGVALQPVVVRGPQEFDDAFAAMKREKAEALIIQPLFVNTMGNAPQLAQMALGSGIPTISDGDGFADAGGLFFYGPDPLVIYQRIAVYVDRVLRGARPAETPVEQPQHFLLVVNLKTAKALGAAIPRSILLRADRVID